MSWETLAWARRARTGSPGRKAVLMVLAEHADEADTCYPSQALIADATEQGERTVRRQLVELEQLGLIRREHRGNGQGGRTSDRYHLLVGPANLAANPTTAAGVTGQSAGVTGQMEGGYRPPVATEQPLENTTTEPPTTRAVAEPDAFDAFWHHYPRKAGKGAARSAWPKAVRAAGSAYIIVQAAQRYAADPNLPPPEYVPHPATWLNGERWADGPLPPRTNGRQPAPARRPIMANTAEAGGRVLTDAELWED